MTVRPSLLPEIDCLVAFDTETSGRHPDDGARVAAVSVAWIGVDDDLKGELHAYAWPFAMGTDRPSGQGTLFDSVMADGGNLPPGEWRALLSWLSRRRLTAHNAKFDLLMMAAGTCDGQPGIDLDEQVQWDTMVGQSILDPLHPSGLKESARRLWGEEATEQQALKRALACTKPRNRYDLVDWSVLGPYATRDAEWTIRLAWEQRLRLEAEDDYLWAIMRRKQKAMHSLYRMERRGIGYDCAISLAQAEVADRLAKQVKGRLPFQPATLVAARKWFFDTQDAVPHCVTAKGEKSLLECCVRSLVSQGVQGAQEWAQLQKVEHAVSKYYRGYPDKAGADGRLRTEFKQMGTITGRYSSTRINLQALPHDYRMSLVEGCLPPRQLFRATPGYQIWEFDLQQAELRLAAKKARCLRMLDLLLGGADVHAETAKAVIGSVDGPNRNIAKRANFGLIYGIGPVTFQRDVEKHTGVILTTGQAKEIVYGWRDLYPQFPRANKKAENLAASRGWVKLAGGRLRWFKPYEELHKAFNAVIQGSIAEFVETWMVEIDRGMPDVRILLQIHDSLVIEIPEADAAGHVTQIESIGGSMATEMFGVQMIADSKHWKGT